VESLPAPVKDPVAEQLERANDIAERRLRDEEFDSIGGEDPMQDYYQRQLNWNLQQQTYDLDRITEIYQQQYYNSLLIPSR
jgi:hypothetical protein